MPVHVGAPPRRECYRKSRPTPIPILKPPRFALPLEGEGTIAISPCGRELERGGAAPTVVLWL